MRLTIAFQRAVGGVALLVLLFGLYRYPLAPWTLAGALAIYGALLWRWPGAWLVAVPALLPVYDLAPWTGWLVVGEADFFVLLTLGVLAMRAPPARQDFWPAAPGRWLLAAFTAWFGVAVVLGLFRAGPPGGTDNVYLSAWQTVRLALPFAAALALLPFARRRQRAHGDALVLFGFGMVAGLAAVAVLVVLERLAFPGLFALNADYRVVGSFSSMHVGGGHIGAYIAFALPFLSVCLLRRRAWSLGLLAAVAVLATYALLVTFARTAYAAALTGALVAAFGGPVAIWLRHRGNPFAGHFARMIPLLVGLSVIGAGLGTVYMSARFEHVSGDFAARLNNWTGGITLPGQSVVDRVIGNGLGSFPRVAFAATPANDGPTNFVVQHTPDGSWLTLEMKRQVYFGQKISTEPGATYHLRLRARAFKPGRLGINLCEKMLLYSENCTGAAQVLHRPGQWEGFEASLTTVGRTGTGWSPRQLRPVEFSVTTDSGATIEVTDISLTDAAGGEHIANGNFAAGTARWLFTDDHHWIWRIFNQYLTSLFELGAIGLILLVVLTGGAFRLGWRAMASGDPMAACFAPALVAIAVSSLFDAVLEAPHLALLFYLIVGFGLSFRPASPQLVTA